MKRYLVLLIALATLTLFIPACGGGGGGGGGGATIGSTNVLKEIALFANPSFVNYTMGDETAEASNLAAALRDMGHTITPFTGTTSTAISNALAGMDVLVMPILTNSDLNAVLDTAARTIISDFVNNGGIFIVSNSFQSLKYSDNLINAVFGYSIVTTANAFLTTLTLDTSAATGTPFEDAVPSFVNGNDATFVIDPATLPSGAKNLYTDPSGNAAMVYIPSGYGHIVIMSYDWYRGKPVGTQDGGWWNVLYRAASLNANHPNAAVMHSYLDSWTNDIAAKIKQSGQFNSVTTLDVQTSTPSLATLQNYDSVLVASGGTFANATSLGDRLADYMDSGGGVALATFSYNLGSIGVGGRFLSDNYYTIPSGAGQTQGTAAYLGTTFYSSHPTLAGVKTFFGGSASYRANTTRVVSGAARIANWDDGRTFLATREINGVRRADLGFYPVSVDVRSDFWDTTTDGDLLMANALTWTADLPEPNYSTTISSDSFPKPVGGFNLAPPFGCIPNTAISTLAVSGGPTSISKVRMNLDITHPNIADVSIRLTSPGATNVWISTNNGQTGSDYSNVTFDDAAGIAIEGLDATFTPFTDTYIPEEPLSTFRGEDANGDWTLTVSDNICALNNGTLNGWGISVR